jgi:hypothetical protein
MIPSIGMFVKRVGKDSLAHNFEEYEVVENEFPSYYNHSYSK